MSGFMDTPAYQVDSQPKRKDSPVRLLGSLSALEAIGVDVVTPRFTLTAVS